jgi:hypothetical protein
MKRNYLIISLSIIALLLFVFLLSQSDLDLHIVSGYIYMLGIVTIILITYLAIVFNKTHRHLKLLKILSSISGHLKPILGINKLDDDLERTQIEEQSPAYQAEISFKQNYPKIYYGANLFKIGFITILAFGFILVVCLLIYAILFSK